MARGVLAALCVFTLVLGSRAEAQVPDVRRPFRTLRTEHFEIHYHAPLGVVARRTAALLEEIHAGLVPLMGYAPRRRTQVVLTDGTESANGSATALPYNTIRLFATAPDDLSVLGDYDDWLSLFITHEHVHILHLDNTGGLPAIVNAVVGKVWAPNHLMPRFITEGIATYVESARSSGGRLRSTLFEMYMRMETLDDRLLRLDELSHGIDAWPFGNVFYLYGSRFIEWVVARHGEETIAKVTSFYGRRVVPYGISRAFYRATGETIEELYDAFLASMRAKHEATRAEIEAHPRGRVEGRQLTRDGMTVQYPRFIDEDTIVYRVSDGQSDNQLRIIDADGSRPRVMSRVTGAPYPSVHPDGDVYADMFDSVRDIYFLYDLFRFDRQSRRWERLTHGRRARAPDVSPNGRHLAFTVNGSGTTHLMIADTADVEATARPLMRSRRFDQVFTPRFSPDGRTIAVSVWEHGGYRDIVLVDVETGETRRITRDRAMDTGPVFSPDNRYLYFSSDRTGIANLYRYRLSDGALEQVTNVLAGAYMPTFSPDGRRLVYVGYTGRGFDLFELDVARLRPWRATPYVDDRPPPREGSAIAPLLSERYRPVRTLYPRSIGFDLAQDGFGQNLGLLVDGTDAAGFYAFNARLGISLENGQPQADAGFTIRRLATPITFGFFRRASPRGGLVVGGESRTWTENAIGGSATLRYTIPHTLYNQSINVGYALTHIGKAEPFGGVLDPNDPPPTLPLLGYFSAASVGYSFSDIRRHAMDISPSEGRTFGVSLSAADPAFGSQYRIAALTWSFNRFYENPFIQHHVLAMRYAGGISGGEAGRRRTFFLGGFPNNTLVDGLVDNIVLGGQALRGYAPAAVSGTRYQLMQLEYRLPLYRPQFGYGTLPLFFRRIHGNVFLDVGDAYPDRFDFRRLRAGVGAEIFIQFATWYFVEWSWRTGFAYGLMEDGGPQVYSHIGFPF